jgi:hypothetical protein
VADTSVRVAVILTTDSSRPDGADAFPQSVQGSPSEALAQFARAANLGRSHGGRTIAYSTVLLDVGSRDAGGRLTGEVVRACREVVQLDVGIVITEAADEGLIRCLVGEGRIVVQSSVGLLDRTSVERDAPLRWAPNAAAIDDIASTLLRTATQSGDLATGTSAAIVVDARDERLTAAAVELQQDVASTTKRDVALIRLPEAGGDVANGVARAREQLAQAGAAAVLSLSPATRLVTDEAPQVGVVIGTAADGNRVDGGAQRPASSQRIVPIGWSPVTDLPPLADAPSGSGAQQCIRTVGEAPRSQQGSPTQPLVLGTVQRWLPLCDAARFVQTALTALPAIEHPVVLAADFADAVHRSAGSWKPAATLGEGWPEDQYLGATTVRTLSWAEPCTVVAPVTPVPAPTGCFSYTGPAQPIQRAD